MYFKSKKISLFILGITSLIFSRTMFFFFDDIEGPNLLVVMVMAVIIYIASLMTYLFSTSTKNISEHFSLATLTNLKKILLVIIIQILLTTAFYFCLK